MNSKIQGGPMVKIVAALAAAALLPVFAPSPSTAAAECSSHRNSRGKYGEPVEVSDAATKVRPVVIEYDQPGGLYYTGSGPTGPGSVFTPVSVISQQRRPKLHVRIDWPTPSPADIDLFLYDHGSEPVAESYAWNVGPLDEVEGNSGGEGFEYIEGAPVRRCVGYWVGTSSWHSLRDRVTLRMWLEGRN